MNLLENKMGLAEMTPPQLHKYINLLEDRIIYLVLDRNKWQAHAQGLVNVRTMFRNQSKRFGKLQTRFAKNQKELFKLKRESQIFKLPPPPKLKKTKLNKHRKKALLRRTTTATSPSSIATFQSSPTSSLSSSSSQGSPLFYNTPQQYQELHNSSPIIIESPFIAYKHPQINESFIDSLYSPSASTAVDLDD